MKMMKLNFVIVCGACAVFLLCGATSVATTYLEDFDDGSANFWSLGAGLAYVDEGGGDKELRVSMGHYLLYSPVFVLGNPVGEGIYTCDMRFNSAATSPGGIFCILSIPDNIDPFNYCIYIHCTGEIGAALGYRGQLLAENPGWFGDIELGVTVASFRVILKDGTREVRVDCDKGLGYEDVFDGYVNAQLLKPDSHGTGTIGVSLNGGWSEGELTQYDDISFTDVFPTELMILNTRLEQGSEGRPYSDILAADFGVETYTWAFVGTPPTGWNIEDADSTTARVWNDDPTSGEISFDVEVTDADLNTASATITLTVIEMDVDVVPAVRLSWESELNLTYQLKWATQMDATFIEFGGPRYGTGDILDYYDQGQETGDSPTIVEKRFYGMGVD